jgi:hypothetical protein
MRSSGLVAGRCPATASGADSARIFTQSKGQVNVLIDVCRSHMRSSSWSQVESSALMGHGGATRGDVDVKERSRPAEGAACGEEAAHQPSAGGELAISPGGVRELLRRMSARGDGAVVHGLRGSGRTDGCRKRNFLLGLDRRKNRDRLFPRGKLALSWDCRGKRCCGSCCWQEVPGRPLRRPPGRLPHSTPM